MYFTIIVFHTAPQMSVLFSLFFRLAFPMLTGNCYYVDVTLPNFGVRFGHNSSPRNCTT
jgi:hypothetical protein